MKDQAVVCGKQLHVIPAGKNRCQQCSNARARAAYQKKLDEAREYEAAKKRRLRVENPSYGETSTQKSQEFRKANPSYHAEKMRELRAKRKKDSDGV